MLVDVGFTAQEIVPSLVKDQVVVILDIFRATSTIVTALANGAKKIFPAGSQEEAYQIKGIYPQALLGGEIKTNKIEGFDLGNSPLEYSTEAVKNRTIIFFTTNGTKAVKRAEGAIQIYLGSFLNAKAVVKSLLNRDQDIFLACAGTQGTYSLEDTCCAGYMIQLLLEFAAPGLSDSARGALALYEQYQNDLPRYLRRSKNGNALLRTGRWQEIQYCCTCDCLCLLPVYTQAGGIVDHRKLEEDK